MGGLLTLFSRIQKGFTGQGSTLNFIHLYKYGISKVGHRGLMFIQSHSKYDRTSKWAAPASELIAHDLSVYTNTRISGALTEWPVMVSSASISSYNIEAQYEQKTNPEPLTQEQLPNDKITYWKVALTNYTLLPSWVIPPHRQLQDVKIRCQLLSGIWTDFFFLFGNPVL